MTTDDGKKLGLADAYAVETPDDNRALYRDWAQTYESEFTDARGYVYHEGVAGVHASRVAADGSAPSAPLLDVGCGTGIVGVALAERGFTTIDGIDISPEMLEQAAGKATYRSLDVVDVTQTLDVADGAYGGVVSVGTFTHGHLGPEPIRELVRVTAAGGRLTLGINAEHFAEHGFEGLFTDLETSGLIEDRELERVRIYEAADDEWADDLASVVTFRRAAS